MLTAATAVARRSQSRMAFDLAGQPRNKQINNTPLYATPSTALPALFCGRCNCAVAARGIRDIITRIFARSRPSDHVFGDPANQQPVPQTGRAKGEDVAQCGKSRCPVSLTSVVAQHPHRGRSLLQFLFLGHRQQERVSRHSHPPSPREHQTETGLAEQVSATPRWIAIRRQDFPTKSRTWLRVWVLESLCRLFGLSPTSPHP